MNPHRLTAVVAAVVILLGVLVTAGEARADEPYYEMECDLYLAHNELPECFTHEAEAHPTGGVCTFQLTVHSACEEELHFDFFCDDHERHCPASFSLKPDHTHDIDLGNAHAQDRLPELHLLLLTDGAIQPSAQIVRSASNFYDDYGYDDWHCGTGMYGCAAAGPTTPSGLLALFVLVGLVALRRSWV